MNQSEIITTVSISAQKLTSSYLPLTFQAYLEAFYKFCSSLGGTTADTMCPILEVSLPFGASAGAE